MVRTAQTHIQYAPLDTPAGRALIAYRGATVLRLSLATSETQFTQAISNEWGVVPTRTSTPPAALRASLKAHFSGRARGRAWDLSRLTPFQQRVLQATAGIPSGEVRTYGQIAAAAGAPRAARAAGSALAHNPLPLLIPCHRVVRSDGAVGAYSGGGPAVKRRLLRAEGVPLRGGRCTAITA